MLSIISILAFLAVFFTLAYNRASLVVWTITTAVGLVLYTKYASSYFMLSLTWLLALVVFLPLNIKSIRRKYISSKAFAIFKKIMPKMSATEKEALEAGTVTWEGDIFSGAPNFNTLFKRPPATLSPEEQAFLDGPVNELCAMVDEWDITHNRLDLPKEVWRFICEQGFLGMIIPKRYGGLEFSASAQAAILTRINGKSVTCATSICVPNSLGPAELLLKYGTEEQKDHYLPRLAKGKDIPCFALTGPNAGSDAASLPDTGVICKGTFDGKEIVGIKLNWDKRYITLAPIATVLGVAFRLYDPEGLIGDVKDYGITCALIPSETKGVTQGRRHFPLNAAFMNGPTQGDDVFVPLDYIIGGQKMAGQGWRMLMECLAAGRAISLPSGAVGGNQGAARTTGAYARVRKQFNMPIGQFEGIEEPLARIAGYTYISSAGLNMAVASIDAGEKPSVASGILKYHTTEFARQVGMDAMDVHGGKGICLGPKNYLGRGYQNIPISITVEGANILTRCLIIFGQGAVRCHPYVLKELQSAERNNLAEFDNALFGHIGHFINNTVRAFLLGITDGRLVQHNTGKLKRQVQLISAYSAQLAFLADFSMMVLGADLKRKEKISARLGDVLSMLYLSSAVIKQYHDDGRPHEDWPVVDWACRYLLYTAEDRIREIIANFPNRWARVLLKVVLSPLGRRRAKPTDALGQKVARLLTTDNETRNRLTKSVFVKPGEHNPVAELEDAFRQLIACESLEKRVAKGVREGVLKGLSLLERIDEAEQKAVLSKDEALKLRNAEMARQRVIAVDDFSHETLVGTHRVEEFKTKPNKKAG